MRRAKERRINIDFPPLIFYDESLDCMVRIDGCQWEIKRPGRRKEIEEFALNLSYSEARGLEADWKPVKRYDCKHHRIEKHEYWISRRAKAIREWEKKPLSEVLTLARRDLSQNYASYVAKMRKKGACR
jgi:hypothetical protein